LKKKGGVGSAHRKRVARQGWWLSGPIPMRGGGLGACAPSGWGVVLRGVLGQPEFGAERKGGCSDDRAPFIGDAVGSGGRAAGGATRR
jgi:hypothetical protein